MYIYFIYFINPVMYVNVFILFLSPVMWIPLYMFEKIMVFFYFNVLEYKMQHILPCS